MKKETYKIDNNTWEKLSRLSKIIVFGSPGFCIGFSFIIWAVVDGFSWILVTVLPWLMIYLFSLLTYRLIFISAKHTAFINSLLAALIVYFFFILGSACVFRLFDYFGLVIELIVFVPLLILINNQYFKYWNKVWESHKVHNENVILDLTNARYDYLNGFNLDEEKIKKKTTKQYSNPALISIAFSIAPMGVGIGMLLFRKEQFTLQFALLAALSLPASLGILKSLAAHFYTYRKLSYYEKQIGKPIINGLLK